MKNKHLFLWLTMICAGLLGLFSCEKEFNPRDKYKDITIVYGLINPVDTFHYIRIHKAFLGPENIIVMAENPDSSLYPVEDLDVRIYEITPDGNSTKLTVDTITKLNKEPGHFYYPKQMMYRFEKIFEKKLVFGEDFYAPESTIKIEVENKKTGKIVYAETSLVHSFNITTPRKGSPLNLKPDQVLAKFQWNNAKNGRIYDVYYTLHYREGRNIDPSDVWKKKSLVWHVGSHSASKTGDGTSPENCSYNPGAFYAQIMRDISYDESVWRSPYNDVRLAVWCGSEDLYYYHNINDPSQGLTQERPEYTNLKAKIYSEELGVYQELENEAFGLFSSRIVQYCSIQLHPEMTQKHLPAVDRQFKSVVYED
jgi:hypothetical protein